MTDCANFFSIFHSLLFFSLLVFLCNRLATISRVFPLSVADRRASSERFFSFSFFFLFLFLAQPRDQGRMSTLRHYHGEVKIIENLWNKKKMVVSNESVDIKNCRLRFLIVFLLFSLFFNAYVLLLFLLVCKVRDETAQTQRNVTPVQVSIGFTFTRGRWMGKIVRFTRAIWNPGHVSVHVHVLERVSRPRHA